ncbi:hypothetical protein NIES4071_104230 (plasmid) [Calothrix sp. NIES-4071]|nr:hypothetical protein NIES4071_104230 [Calothrix sp. NIES-4071]BAZ64410.1 hypothetical protein NIES4105_101430 [Calothrix sp. NIES-4105]
MQVLEIKNNPWTLAERQILSAIVNEALSIQLDAANIIGAVTSGSECEVIWCVEGERNSFWFPTAWFRERVQFKKAEREARHGEYSLWQTSQELVAECKKRNFAILPIFDTEECWHIVKLIGNRYVGQIAWVNGAWMIRNSNTDWKNAGKQVHDAIFSLWMLEVAKLATGSTKSGRLRAVLA